MIIIGADSCPAGWFYFEFERSKLRYDVVPAINELVRDITPDDLLLIDIPIGLSRGGPDRECDTLARTMLHPQRSSSVFSVPCRDAVYSENYTVASAVNLRMSGRKLSSPSWAITSKIREVDRLLVANYRLRGVVREVHPEVIFCGMHGAPMKHAKRTDKGVNERLRVLRKFFPDARDVYKAARADFTKGEVANDNIVDALAAAIIGKRFTKRLTTLPAQPPSDSAGLAMEMVYVNGAG